MSTVSTTIFRSIISKDASSPVLLEGYDCKYLRTVINESIECDPQEPLVSFDAHGSMGIDEVRSLISRLSRKSSVNRYVVLENAHGFRHEAANALLKLLEEPPRNTFIFLTSHPYGTLSTIRSRCMIVKFFYQKKSREVTKTVSRPLAQSFQELADFSVEEGRFLLERFIHEARNELLTTRGERAQKQAEVLQKALRLFAHGSLSKITLQNIFVAWKYA